jgi:hypothetical protein
MSAFPKTEFDVLRESIKKVVLVPTEDPTLDDGESQLGSTVSRRD